MISKIAQELLGIKEFSVEEYKQSDLSGWSKNLWKPGVLPRVVKEVQKEMNRIDP
ncbi:MAG: hypothetical protein AAGG81_01190 [Chlamydiota bacterium]